MNAFAKNCMLWKSQHVFKLLKLFTVTGNKKRSNNRNLSLLLFANFEINDSLIAIFSSVVSQDDFSFNNICKQILELLRKYKHVDTDALLRKLKDIK